MTKMVTVQIEEETWDDLQKLIESAEENLHTSVTLYKMLWIVTSAINHHRPVTLIDNTLHIDGVPISDVIIDFEKHNVFKEMEYGA